MQCFYNIAAAMLMFNNFNEIAPERQECTNPLAMHNVLHQIGCNSHINAYGSYMCLEDNNHTITFTAVP